MADAAAFDFTVKTIKAADGTEAQSIQILDSVLSVFENAAQNGFDNLAPEAMWLVGVFAIINICTTWALYDGELRLSQMIAQIMKIGAFYFLVMNMGKINNAIMVSFQSGGLIAALGPDGAKSFMNQNGLTPSGLLDIGIGLTSKIWSINGGIETTIQKLVAIGLIVFSFFVMSIQLLLTKLEFNIFAAVAVILLPFGALNFTKFLFQRAVSAVFAFGVKLMMCYFMLGVVVKQSENLKKGFDFMKDGQGQVSFGLLFSAALGYVAIGYLVWKVPTIVSGMMNGTPALDGNEISRKAGQAASRAAHTVTRIPGKALRAYGSVSSTAATAAENARNTVAGKYTNVGGAIAPVSPTKGRYAWEFAKQAARQQWASFGISRQRIAGANKALGHAADYRNIDTGRYKRQMQGNRNNP